MHSKPMSYFGTTQEQYRLEKNSNLSALYKILTTKYDNFLILQSYYDFVSDRMVNLYAQSGLNRVNIFS